ncbi:lactonase family protein [Sphingomonas sp. XXL09]|uniref:lactonase family protein n=1 Tax=Sphingomonas sp. XXL09 TaxID=3457787 RepID=UPI00406BD2E4
MLAAGSLPARGLAASPATLIAGTYAKEGGPGLVSLDSGGSRWSAGKVHRTVRNASFGVTSPRTGLRYLVDEQQTGGLGIYDASFRLIAASPTLGADPCHLALSSDGKMLAAANYSSGSVILWTLNEATGLPHAGAQLIEHHGHGPNRERQAAPHAHWVGFAAGNAILHAVDLGADAIFAHHIDRATGRIADTRIAYRAESGSGPRHLLRHPGLPIAYLVAELANTVTVLRAGSDGTFVRLGAVSSLPAGFHGTSFAAHIAINAAGTRLYVSNRGHDSIAVFELGARGMPRMLQHVPSGGHWPRFFKLMESRGEMLVANQRSGGVAVLPVGADGRLSPMTTNVRIRGVAFVGD